MINNYVDPVKLSCELIKIESITPFAGNSIDTLINILKPWDLNVKAFLVKVKKKLRIYMLDMDIKSPNLCFAGHVDVVPPGNEKDWSFKPFSEKS